jgi:hypothetical protein
MLQLIEVTEGQGGYADTFDIGLEMGQPTIGNS